MTDAPTVFFVHLHKTAGTSLWKRMQRVFEPLEMFPNGDDGDVFRRTISVDDLVERWPQRRGEVRVLAGHFPLCTREVLGGEFDTFTLLRDPVERVVSALREQRQKLPEFADTPFETIYDDRVRRLLVVNHATKMFALRAEEMSDGVLTSVDFSNEHFERAIEGLASVDTVGFQDDVEEFAGRLEARYDWNLGAPMVANSSVPEEIPSSLVDRIAEENALDIRLFEYALANYRTD